MTAPEPESRFTKPRQSCPHPEFWHSWDDQATEVEVVDGVAGLVRLLQPEYVLETGTHRGFMAAEIGEALVLNGHGRLDTIEHDKRYYTEARKRCAGLPVECHLGDSLEFTPRQPIDFAWLDSGTGTTRIEEFAKFYPHMHGLTIVGVHDTAALYAHDTCRALEKRGVARPIFFPTPRGMALMQVLKSA